ncbi:aminotransferase class I/II-fold pyridoxal phosphate-dependent enzyme [Streptomyces sp. MCAF7]
MGRPLLNRRLAEFGTTIFAEMSALAVETGSINLGQGFPDSDGPEEVREAAVRALRDGRGNQYPPGPGIPELRTAVAEHQRRWYGLSYDPDREVLITAGATEATFSFTGWKVGWVTGSAELVAAVRSAKQFLTYVSSGPFQYAVAEALRLPDSYFHTIREDLLAKRDLLAGGLADAGFTVFRPSGTYFITTDIRPLGETDGFAFCRALPERCGVVAIPNAVFYDHQDQGSPFVRFAFCKRESVLEEAATRLKSLAG